MIPAPLFAAYEIEQYSDQEADAADDKTDFHAVRLVYQFNCMFAGGSLNDHKGTIGIKYFNFLAVYIGGPVLIVCET